MTKRQRAYNEIKRQILFLELKPGQRILENDIIEKLQIGRTPVREALLTLEHEKLIQRENKSGFFAKRLSLQDAYDYIGIRKILEAYAVPLVIERITPAEFNLLHVNLKDTENAIKDKNETELIRCESTFHDILYKATKSDVFIETISRLSDKFQWLRAIAIRNTESVVQSQAQHAQIIKGIKRKDEAEVKHITDRHLEHLEECLAIARNFFLLDA